MKGLITVTDEKGGTILSADIWYVLLTGMYCGRLILDPTKVRIFIDGIEIVKPSAFEDGT